MNMNVHDQDWQRACQGSRLVKPLLEPQQRCKQRSAALRFLDVHSEKKQCWDIEFGVKITGTVLVWSPFTSRAPFDEVQVVHDYFSVLMAPMQNSEWILGADF